MSSAAVALHATSEQASSTQQQSAEEFQRSQKRDAYSALLASATEINRVELEAYRAVPNPDDPAKGVSQRILTQLETTYGDFEQAVAGVELAGSTEAAAAAKRLRDVHLDALIDYRGAVTRLAEGDQAGAARAIKDVGRQLGESVGPSGDFVRIARKDMGMEP